MLVVILLGFSSGLPLALVGGTLQAWMKAVGVKIEVIGLFALTGWPYAIKYVWAPLLDRYTPGLGPLRFLDRRRGWMLISQACLVGALLILSGTDPAQEPLQVAALALAVAFFSATQDIVIDAYRAEVLDPAEFGLGASVAVLGYRLGMLTSGAFGLVLADQLAWGDVYRVMAGIMAVGMVAALIAPAPDATRCRPPETLAAAVVAPFIDFFSRRGSVEVLLFIILYKIGDVLAASLTTPFLIDLGFSRTEIGVVSKGIGVFATILGGVTGGVLMLQLGMRRALLFFGILQGVSTLCFYALALVGYDTRFLTLAIGVENVCGGFGTTALTAFLMSLCTTRFTATQYALLSSFTALNRVFGGAAAGYLQAALGWPAFFLVAAALAIPGIGLLALRFDRWQTDRRNDGSS
jgi:PAT family beta-lactamase induction signal transducer AmpG